MVCACLSILSKRTHKNISGAQAGKENLALAQCCVSLKKKKKKDCSKDKKITASDILGTWRGAARGTSMLISGLWVCVHAVLCKCAHTVEHAVLLFNCTEL